MLMSDPVRPGEAGTVAQRKKPGAWPPGFKEDLEMGEYLQICARFFWCDRVRKARLKNNPQTLQSGYKRQEEQK